MADAASQRLALYYVIGLVALVVMAVLDWPGLQKGEWADIFTVSAMIAAISAGVCQGGLFLVRNALRIYNERVRNQGRIETLDFLERKKYITPEERRMLEQEHEQERREKSKP